MFGPSDGERSTEEVHAGSTLYCSITLGSKHGGWCIGTLAWAMASPGRVVVASVADICSWNKSVSAFSKKMRHVRSSYTKYVR